MGKKKKLRCDIQPVYDQSASRRHAAIPCAVTGCANYAKLSVNAKALILDAASLFNGTNNGDICLALTTMAPMGWNKTTLWKARLELEYYRFINVHVRPVNRKPTLYSLAWVNIQKNNGASPATMDPSKTYLVERPIYTKPTKKCSIEKETLALLRHGVVAKHAEPNEVY